MSSPRHELTPEELREGLVQILGEMSDEELERAVEEFEELNAKLHIAGPQTPDELHAWVKEEIGIDIPRTKVCDDHDAPFWFFCDLFFEEKVDSIDPDGTKRTYGGVGSALLMANRGGGKTFLVALLHYANSTFKPGIESLTFGATQYQSKRCYEHLTPWVTHVVEGKDGNKRKRPKPGIEDSQKSETIWYPVVSGKRGSKVEIVSGTPEAVNGPHPNVVHADEAEQMRADTWDESRNMAIAGVTADGRKIKPRNIVTSTRKTLHGRMQKLIDEVRAAEAEGMRAPYRFYQYCIFETAAQIPNCREAPENADLPEEEKCECNKIPKGNWPDGTRRTLDTVCQGRFYKSRGWQPQDQIEELFTQNIRIVWEAQQECRRPETENNYVQWEDSLHGIRDYDPDPDFGPIYEGIDWGAGNPNAVNLYQLLNVDVEVVSYHGDWKVLPAGSWVCFDEIYEAEIGAGRLADKVIQMERKWRSIHPKWKVEARFADPQGRQQRHDFNDHGLKTRWVATRDFEYHVELVQNLFEDDHFYADLVKAEMFCQEILAWRKDPQTGKQVDEFNHCMSNMRYAVANVHRIDQKESKKRGTPQSSLRKRKTSHQARGPVGLAGQTTSAVVNEFGERP